MIEFYPSVSETIEIRQKCEKTYVCIIRNTLRLYSQWLNRVIYWLINHCTDRTRTGVTSFGHQFDFS